ncbi:MAG: VWA domain-containing protein [Coriobacteriales bacterium]|nr:VWA domain-containing protein [Coriobacteriales bacterium]
MKENLTELVFILDRSGSMGGLEDDTIGGFNSTLDTHKAEEGEAVVSTVLFDHETKVLHDRVPIQKVEHITRNDYQVRGSTALLDAVGSSIRHIERVHSYLPEEYRPARTIFVITTDGYENSSHKYTYGAIKETIERKRKEDWEFLFLGANIDAVKEAERIGIHQDRAVTYMADSQGQRLAYESVNGALSEMRCSKKMSAVSGAWKAAVEADTAARGSKPDKHTSDQGSKLHKLFSRK